MSRGFVKESWVRMLLFCRVLPGRLGLGIGDGCRRDVACESILTYGGFTRASCSCKLIVVAVSDMMKKESILTLTGTAKAGREKQQRLPV